MIFKAQFPGLPGLTLNAQLYDDAGAPVGSLITTGFVALPAQPDVYLLSTVLPAGHVGALVVYAADDPTASVSFSINPQDTESSAADVWSYGNRTLTTTVPGATLVVTAGPALSLVKAISFDVAITGLSIPANWAKIYFTVKANNSEADNKSLIQIVISNPSAGSDGLLYLNAAAAASASDGTLTVDQPGGNITISITDDGTSLLNSGSNYGYDIKVITSASKSSIIANGTMAFGTTPTLAVA
jgi:hypothetical protein